MKNGPYSSGRIPGQELKLLQKLSQRKYREEERRFVVEGAHLVGEAVASSWQVESVIVRESEGADGKFAAIVEAAAKKDIAIKSATARDFEKLADTVSSQGIAAVVRYEDRAKSERWGNAANDFIAVGLNNISDPGNLGTIVRTCAWFGVDMLLVDRGSVDLFNPKSVRSTMGAIFHLPVHTGIELRNEVEEAKRNGFSIASTTLTGGSPLERFRKEGPLILLLGNESHGIDEDLRRQSDVKLTIPRRGSGESLNVAVACGVVLNAITTDPSRPG